MQRTRRRVKRQRNDSQISPACYSFNNTMSGSDASLQCHERPLFPSKSLQNSRAERMSSDASTSTEGPAMSQATSNPSYEQSSFWSQFQRQVYIGNSHCPIDGWYQACRNDVPSCRPVASVCRVCNSWTAAELEICGKLVPLCKGCQLKCHQACTKPPPTTLHHDPQAATSSALLALDRAWEDYLNKLRADNGMHCH